MHAFKFKTNEMELSKNLRDSLQRGCSSSYALLKTHHGSQSLQSKSFICDSVPFESDANELTAETFALVDNVLNTHCSPTNGCTQFSRYSIGYVRKSAVSPISDF